LSPFCFLNPDKPERKISLGTVPDESYKLIYPFLQKAGCEAVQATWKLVVPDDLQNMKNGVMMDADV
jgi:hypothetical protein